MAGQRGPPSCLQLGLQSRHRPRARPRCRGRDGHPLRDLETQRAPHVYAPYLPWISATVGTYPSVIDWALELA